MQIDWLTVAAQIVNFLILVWLLQHFLYGPITRAMAAREQRIADRLDEAREARRKAEEEAAAYRERQVEFDRERERRIEQAEADAAETRRELEQAARDDIDAERRAWREQLEAQRRSFLDDLRRQATEQFYALARHALDDLADVDLEQQMARGFARRLRELDEPARARIAEAAGDAVVIDSRFPLDADARRQVTRAVHDVLGGEVDVDYAEAADAAIGVELVAGSQRVAWTLESYLDDLEAAVAERLRSEPERAAAGADG